MASLVKGAQRVGGGPAAGIGAVCRQLESLPNEKRHRPKPASHSGFSNGSSNFEECQVQSWVFHKKEDEAAELF